MIKTVASLNQKKYRDDLGLFIVEGVRLVEELAYSDWKPISCFYTGEALQQDRIRKMIVHMERRRTQMYEVSEEVFRKISDTAEPQGILAVTEKMRFSLTEVASHAKNPVFVILDALQDPGNVGTVIRTAVAAGCTGIFATQGCADLFAAKTVRASMGALFHIPVCQEVTCEELVTVMKNNRIDLIATSLEASDLYYHVDYRSPIAIVFGNEGNGVGHGLLVASKTRIHIPLLGKVESLNVASAAAVILYETVRQRR
jgi:TrmH family RNA methyltransferase